MEGGDRGGSSGSGGNDALQRDTVVLPPGWTRHVSRDAKALGKVYVDTRKRGNVETWKHWREMGEVNLFGCVCVCVCVCSRSVLRVRVEECVLASVNRYTPPICVSVRKQCLF